jgi:ssDNA thymidine ADP-ribosyltransferase, DarT
VLDLQLNICYASIVNLGAISALWYITHIDNLPSIFEVGILCHNEAAKLPHVRVDNREVNERRNRLLPNRQPLHNHAILYFNPRNAMMYRLVNHTQDLQHTDLALVGVSPDVRKLQGVYVADVNAATSWVRFAGWDELFPLLKREEVFIRDWRHQDEKVQKLQMARAMAEVLVPNRVQPQYIIEIAASCHLLCDRMNQMLSDIAVPLHVRHDMFWQHGPGPKAKWQG